MTLYLPGYMDLHILWCHEEDSGQCASVHLRYRDGEDREPGEHTDECMDQSQYRVTQQQPHISTDATLQKHREILNSVIMCKYY